MHDGQPLAGKIRSAWKAILEDAGLDEDVIRHTPRLPGQCMPGPTCGRRPAGSASLPSNFQENYGHHHADFQSEAAEAFCGRR
jgi:hypothetical protein